MSDKPKRTRLNDSQRLRVLTLIARGDSRQAVVDEIKSRFDISITVGAVDKMKEAHADSIAAMRQTIHESEVADAELLLTRSRRLLGKKLTKAEQDEATLDELYADYRKGRITWKDLQQKKAGLLKISISELNAVTKEMYVQTGGGGDSHHPALGSGMAQTEALIAAIQKQDTVELQRIIFRSGGNHDKPVPV